jgi:hypothetical protein
VGEMINKQFQKKPGTNSKQIQQRKKCVKEGREKESER